MTLAIVIAIYMSLKVITRESWWVHVLQLHIVFKIITKILYHQMKKNAKVGYVMICTTKTKFIFLIS